MKVMLHWTKTAFLCPFVYILHCYLSSSRRMEYMKYVGSMTANELNMYVSREPSKYWYAYIRTFMHLTFLNIYCFEGQNEYIACPGLWYNTEISTAPIFVSGLKICVERSELFVHVVNTTKVIRKIGIIRQYESTMEAREPTLSLFFTAQFNWQVIRDLSVTFRLDPKLWLNITFHRIYIFTPVSNCLLFKDTLFKIGRVIVLVETNVRAIMGMVEDEVHLCGMYSHMNFFPQHHNSRIKVYGIGFQTVVYLTVSVMDSHSLFTPINPHTPVAHFEWQINILLDPLVVQSFHIQVVKYNIVVMNLSHVNSTHSLKVYDGPTGLSNFLLPSRNGKFQASSFQCCIHLVLVKAKASLSRSVLEITSTGLPTNRKRRKFNVSSSSITLNPQQWAPVLERPFTFFLEVACLKRTKINMSLAGMVSSNLDHFTCRNAGLTVFYATNNSLKEYTTFCGEHSVLDSYYTHRNVFPDSDTVVLVYYLHQPQAELNMTLTFSENSCRVVQINSCQFAAQPVFHNYFDADIAGFETMSLANEKCLVVQLSYSNFNNSHSRLNQGVIFPFESSCGMFLRPKSDSSGGKMITYNITGHFTAYTGIDPGPGGHPETSSHSKQVCHQT